MQNKNVLIKFLFVFLLVVPLAKVAVAQINNNDSKGLLADIPEPPNAKTELPSPVPMVYRFMGALMDGEYDVCLSNFDVQTFLELLYGKQYTRLEKEEYNELFSYQIQTHRNEFRFLSKIKLILSLIAFSSLSKSSSVNLVESNPKSSINFLIPA